MKYKISDVSKILNIPIDTLRFYEKRGIINPNKDSKTAYRVFDDWDINYLLEYQRYRKMDYTLPEIRNIMYDLNYKEYLKLIKEKQELISRKAKYYQLLEIKNLNYIKLLENIDFDYHLSDFNTKIFIPHRKNFEYKQSKELGGVFKYLMEYYALIDNAVVFRYKDIISNEDNFEWGFGIEKNEANKLEIPYDNNLKIEEISINNCIRFIVNAGERWNFSKQLLNPVFEYMKQNKYYLNGNIYGRLLARINDTEYLRYIEFFVPFDKH